MTLRDDLIAAKALIDTPEKLAAVGSVRNACLRACDLDLAREGNAFAAVMDQPGDPRFVTDSGHGWVRVEFESILDRFDRAIEAAS